MNPQSLLEKPPLEARIAALRPALDLVGLPVCILDAAQRFRYVNAAYLADAGKSLAEFAGRTPDEVFERKPQDSRRAQLARALRGETVIYNRRNAEGPNAGRWMRAHYFPLREAGEVIGVLVVLVDVQQLKDTEQALAERERQLSDQRKQLQLVVDNIGVPMTYLDRQGYVRFANQPALDWNIDDAAQAIGRRIEDLCDPATWEVIRPQMQAALAGEKRVYERLATTRDGRRKWVRVHLVPDRAADGTVRGLYTLMLDVDADHRTREALERQQARLRHFAENLPGPVAVVDAGFRYIFANNFFQRLHGLPLERIVGRTVHEVLGPAKAARYVEPYREILMSGEPCSYERLIGPPGAEERWYQVRLVPIMDEGRFNGYYIVASDIHDIKTAQDGLRQAQAALEDKERQLRQVIDSIPTPMCYVDAEGLYRYVNDAFLAYVGRPAERIVGQTVREVLGEDRWQLMVPILERVKAGESLAVERLVRFADGHSRWMTVRLTPRFADGRYLGYYATTSDIHEQKLVEEELRRANTILSAHFDNTPLAVIEWDTEMRIVRWSGQAEAIFGWQAAETLGRPLAGWRHIYEEDREAVEAVLRGLMEGRERHATMLHRNYRKDGSVIWVEWHNSALRDQAGRVISILSLAQDVSSRMQAEERLQFMATHDGLTGLPNSVLLNDRLEAALLRAHRGGRRVGLMFLDLDHFKDVNDTLGHRVGDLLLKELARRIRAALRQSDLLARISGDEFVILLEDLADDRAPEQVASKVLDEVRRPFRIEGHEIQVSGSLGLALHPEDGADAETLLKNADAAMYHAKELGRNGFRLFSRDLAERRVLRLRLESALRRALREGELLLHYQPILDIAAGTVRRAEALVRWNDPERGLVLPQGFIPLAEESGLAHAVGHWVLEQACRQARAWRDAGIGEMCIAVNVSASQLRDASMAADLEATLAATGCDASWLQLEITETGVVRDVEGASHVLSRLRALGVRVAIDDFGTGFSSLSHLRNLPLDLLKVDRTFVADIEPRPRRGAAAGGAAIVSAVIGLARGLGLDVVAEGVETKAQLDFLAAQGCGAAQGYFICPPLPAAEFEAWLRSRAAPVAANPRRKVSRKK